MFFFTFIFLHFYVIQKLYLYYFVDLKVPTHMFSHLQEYLNHIYKHLFVKVSLIRRIHFRHVSNVRKKHTLPESILQIQ